MRVSDATVTALATLCIAATVAWSVPDIVRHDWYFRETMGAVRNWEAILARWEAETPEDQRTPVLPVPADGRTVTWPNPFPKLLLPPKGWPEAHRDVQLRWVDGAARVERLSGDGDGDTIEARPGEAVLGYKHPCGGGKDQWYHAHHRRFDGLTQFVPKVAPFWVEIDAPLDFGLGANVLRVRLKGAGEEPIVVQLRLRLLTPKGETDCGERPVTIARDADHVVRLPFELNAEGGGLLLLSLGCGDDLYWVPLLTYVENVPAVLDGVGRILLDAPDREAAAGLAELRSRAKHGTGDEWRWLFTEASALRDDLLLRRLDFDTLLFLRRKPFFSEQPFMDAHHLVNRPGGGSIGSRRSGRAVR